MPPKSRSARSSPSSPPRKSARAPASACRWSMAWRGSRAAPRGSRARPAKAPRSSFCSARPTARDRRGRRPACRPSRRAEAERQAGVDPGHRRRSRRSRLHRRQRSRSRAIASARRPTAARACAEATRDTPDLVILDFIMPGLSGRRRRQPAPREAPRPADPVRLGLQRNGGGADRCAQRAAARQTVPRRSARQGGAERAGAGKLGPGAPDRDADRCAERTDRSRVMRARCCDIAPCFCLPGRPGGRPAATDGGERAGQPCGRTKLASSATGC